MNMATAKLFVRECGKIVLFIGEFSVVMQPLQFVLENR
jgi:hypothetical protein